MGLYIKQNGAIKPLAGSTPGEGLPVGAITAFTANSIPSGWLLCDGSTFDETLYPALFLALGGNVLPDLRNRFLEGADSVIREYKEAGLPNITGSVGNIMTYGVDLGNLSLRTEKGSTSGEYSRDYTSGDEIRNLLLDASQSSEVYGNSDTVQPASYTVNYIIKATSGITTEAALDAFNMIKEYERKQNLLSDIEVIPLVEANTDYIAEYDGYLMINLYKSASQAGSTRRIRVNGILFRQGIQGLASGYAGETSTIPLNKGDVWSVDYSDDMNFFGRWYKLRDYSGR